MEKMSLSNVVPLVYHYICPLLLQYSKGLDLMASLVFETHASLHLYLHAWTDEIPVCFPLITGYHLISKNLKANECSHLLINGSLEKDQRLCVQRKDSWRTWNPIRAVNARQTPGLKSHYTAIHTFTCTPQRIPEYHVTTSKKIADTKQSLKLCSKTYWTGYLDILMDTVDNYFLLDRLESLGIIDSTCQITNTVKRNCKL